MHRLQPGLSRYRMFSYFVRATALELNHQIQNQNTFAEFSNRPLPLIHQ